MPHEEGGQGGIGPVHLWGFDQAFRAIDGEGRDPMEEERGFEQVEIPIDRRLGYSSVAGRLRLVQQLSGTQGDKLHHPPKVGEGSDLGEIPQIPFQIGAHVSPPPFQDRFAGVELQQGWHEPIERQAEWIWTRGELPFAWEFPGEEVAQQIRWLLALMLAEGQGAEHEVNGPPGQRFAHPVEEEEVCRSGKDESSGPVLVDRSLYR